MALMEEGNNQYGRVSWKVVYEWIQCIKQNFTLRRLIYTRHLFELKPSIHTLCFPLLSFALTALLWTFQKKNCTVVGQGRLWFKTYATVVIIFWIIFEAKPKDHLLIPCSDRHFYCVNLNKFHYWEQYFIKNFN